MGHSLGLEPEHQEMMGHRKAGSSGRLAPSWSVTNVSGNTPNGKTPPNGQGDL
jgi:hypothetical protein